MSNAKEMPAYVVNAAKADAKLQALQERMALEKQEAVLKVLPTPCYVVDEARLAAALCAAGNWLSYFASPKMLFHVSLVSLDGGIFSGHHCQRHF